MRKKRIFGCTHAGTETHYYSLNGKQCKKRACLTQEARKVHIFGLLHEKVEIPLGSAETHYHPLSTKQRKIREHMMMQIKSFEKATASGELNRLMETGDHIEGLIKSKRKKAI